MTAERTQITIDDVARECLAVRTRMLNRVVSGIYDDALRPLGLKASQMNILVATAKMDVARPAEVCRHLHLDPSTLSRNVERMMARGWIEVTPDDEDLRAQPFRLTRAGRHLLNQALPAWRRAQKAAIDVLGDDVVKLLAKTTRRIHEASS